MVRYKNRTENHWEKKSVSKETHWKASESLETIAQEH